MDNINDKKLNKEKLVHDFFLVGVILKGLNGALEILGGFFLLFTSLEKIGKLAIFLTKEELLEDKNDFIANYLLHVSQSFSIGAQHFGAFYLLSHGIIKVLLVAALLKKKLWAYPTAIIIFILFILYQLYLFSHTHSVSLIFLTLLDIFVIVLTYLEYQRLKRVV